MLTNTSDDNSTLLKIYLEHGMNHIRYNYSYYDIISVFTVLLQVIWLI